LSRHGFADLFSKPLGRYETARSFFTGPAEARVQHSIPYYNLRPILVPTVLSLILLIRFGLGLLRPLLDRAAKFLFAIGRHSLDAYILHLSLLALVIEYYGGNRRPLTKTWQGDAVVIGAVIACQAWSLGREAWQKRRKKMRMARAGASA
jgi:peptidoglycan/LPS O-acetylase OafA/YrhL